MKYIKPYKIFESNYSFEGYVGAISNEFSKYNISAVGIREMIESYKVAIEEAIENNIDPYTFVKTIVDDMDLSDGGGFMDQGGPSQQQTTVKYL